MRDACPLHAAGHRVLAGHTEGSPVGAGEMEGSAKPPCEQLSPGFGSLCFSLPGPTISS